MTAPSQRLSSLAQPQEASETSTRTEESQTRRKRCVNCKIQPFHHSISFPPLASVVAVVELADVASEPWNLDRLPSAPSLQLGICVAYGAGSQAKSKAWPRCHIQLTLGRSDRFHHVSNILLDLYYHTEPYHCNHFSHKSQKNRWTAKKLSASWMLYMSVCLWSRSFTSSLNRGGELRRTQSISFLKNGKVQLWPWCDKLQAFLSHNSSHTLKES